VILWLGIGVGLIAGLGLSKWRRQPYHPPSLMHIWLVFVGFLPQFFAIYLWKTRSVIPDRITALCLIISQFILFLFAWLNRRLPGMPILIVGLILNMVVIAINGGFMPVSPQTAERLVGEEAVSGLMIGSRFGFKDILLPAQETRLEILADRFLPPPSFHYQVAFSLGDIFITFGAFWMLANQRTVT